MNEIYHLKSYMKENKLTQKNVADMLGISEAAVSRYLSFSRQPNEKIQKQLAQILGIKTFVTKDILEMKRVIERLIKENLSNYSSAEKLHLIAILSE